MNRNKIKVTFVSLGCSKNLMDTEVMLAKLVQAGYQIIPPDEDIDADVIIAKGQGNTETLYGCGYNIYYAFLVKCARFVQVFEKPMLTPMLVRERK